MATARDIISDWPEESREAAQLVIDAFGEPHESAPSRLTWFDIDNSKRVVAKREFSHHDFPAPHTDSVTSTIAYRVPPELASDIVAFDGSVTIARTDGEVSATCHDVEANHLALNLVDDIVRGVYTAQEARDYYGKEFLDYRRGKATPYMRKLRMTADENAADSDERSLSDDDLEQAKAEGERRKEQLV
ncbi:MAG TPA: hypothetical protein PK781_05160 [Terrimesophilobacter sp.]|nr:hypothetical protein [Terrimesophilobacter sp.]HRP99833.1 hypothetical protein [Terrimesophilobacter sp.]